MLRALDRIAGILTGLITGIVPGLEWPIRFIMHDLEVERYRYAAPLITIFSPLFTVPWYMIQGAITGARQGLTGALIFPVIQHRRFAEADEIDEICEKLKWVTDAAPAWLTSDEEKKLDEWLNGRTHDQTFKALISERDRYRRFLDHKCPITGLPVRQIPNPVIIDSANGGTLALTCTRAGVLSELQTCRANGKPAAITLREPYNRTINIHKDQLNTRWPQWITDFLQKVRKRLSLWHNFQQTVLTGQKDKEGEKAENSAQFAEEKLPEPVSPRTVIENMLCQEENSRPGLSSSGMRP